MRLLVKDIVKKLGSTSFYYNTEIDSSITGVYGPSGAGKSTLLNILCGIEKPNSGLIEFNDQQLYNSELKINVPVHKRNIGVVFQDNYLFPHLNIKQNLLFSETYNKNKDAYIDLHTVIELLQINHLLTKKPAQLSGGERQRVAIGRTLLSQPNLLLFDEPFSSLDRQRRKEIISYLLKINNRFKIPLLIISHDLEDILRLTNKLLVIDNQKIIASGNYESIAEKGLAPKIISHKRFLNVFDVFLIGYDRKHKLFKFAGSMSVKKHLYTNSELLKPGFEANQKVRLCISPDDIALANEKIADVSIRNQVKGKIVKLLEKGNSIFVTIDCGFMLVAEISIAAYEQLKLECNKEVYCLIKAKAIEIVHAFKTGKTLKQIRH